MTTDGRAAARCPALGGEIIATDNTIQVYLTQINDVPLLTAQEERDLALAIQAAQRAAADYADGKVTLSQREQSEQRGHEARERMVRSNLRLVVKIAKNYLNRGMALSDLVEEGNLGLIRAVEGFDPAQGARFSTYGSWWIKQAIKRALINTVQPVHIPAYMVEMIARWKQAQREFQESNGRTPTIQELAVHMQMPERKVRMVRRAVRAFAAPTQSGSSSEGLSLSELLPDDRTPAPESSVFSENEAQTIQALLNQIDEREATILRMRYGLDDHEPMTLKQIGAAIGLTRERVRQIEAEARKKLSDLLTSRV